MLKKILIGLLFLSIISCQKKEDNSHLLSKYIKIDRVINTGCEYKGGQPGFLIAVLNDEIMMRPQLTDYGMRMNVYNVKTNKMRVENFKLEKSINDTLKYSYEPYDFEVTSKNVFAIFGNNLLVIDRNDSKNTYLADLKEPFQKLKVFGNEILFCRAYDFSPSNFSKTGSNAPINIAKYDLVNKKVIKYIDLKSDALEFSYFTPSNWLDISEKGDIVFTQAISPVQNIYDKNLELKQILTYKPKNWKNVDMTELNYLRKLKTKPIPQVTIEHLYKTDDGPGCRMISVDFANDSTLLVFYTSPSKADKPKFVRYCNIWKRKNDKWVLFDKELRDAYPELSTVLSKDNFPFNGSMHSLRFHNNKVYYIDVSLNQNKLLQFGEKFSVIKKEMDRCFAEDKLYHQLFIYNCRF